MSARSSECPRGRGLLGRVRDERGSVVVLVAVGMVVLLCGSAFALEFGRAYLGILRLSRAVDAGTLAAARVMRLGQSGATAQAMAVAAANGVENGKDGVHLEVAYVPNSKGQMTVQMTARRSLPMILGRLMGRESLTLSSSAAAASPPVDLMMVIDQSGSLASAHAWDDLQQAAITFLGFFGPGYDQLGLVSFQTRAVTRRTLRTDFATTVKSTIQQMTSFGSTNIVEGLRMAQVELGSSRVRTGSLKAVIFFTDGWANTLRVQPYGIDAIVATSTNGPTPVGSSVWYYLNPDQLPTDKDATISGYCNNMICPGITPTVIVNSARADALTRAAELRAAGVYVYTIGLKDPAVSQLPDMVYLREMANEGGVASASQPQGKAYYAPTSKDLQEMFTRVASDLMVHLVR